MTTVNSTTQTNSTTNKVAGTGKSLSSLDMNDFITLMTTQLKYQDPTNPQDASKYVSELAQFSSVSGIQEMNSSISSLLTEMRNSQTLSATSLVGHSVLAAADTATLASGESLSGAVDTPTGATTVNVTVTNQAGETIRQFSVPTTSGKTEFNWDGMDDSGKQVAAGTYSVSAIATVNGKTEQLSTMLSTKVSSVTMNTDNSLTLNTSNLGSLKLSDVKQVS